MRKGDKAMFTITKNFQMNVEAIADERTDITTAPTSVGIGSACLVLEDSSVWVLNSQHKWQELNRGDNNNSNDDDNNGG